MALINDLNDAVAEILAENWQVRDGRVVPDPEDLALANDAVKFDRATVLYADLAGSTSMVDTNKWHFAAEIYKSYLYCAARIIRAEGGVITAYDGDRVMGVFVGETQSTPAARCALKINYAVQQIINPAIKAEYPKSTFKVRQVVGIDSSPIRAARTGVRGGNDLVWVGRAANYAAKLANIDGDKVTWITKAVFDRLHNSAKYGASDNRLMWEQYSWNQMGGHTIYGSSWTWKV